MASDEIAELRERLDASDARADRLECGLLTLTAWLTQVPGCLGQHEYEPMRKIVQGDNEVAEN